MTQEIALKEIEDRIQSIKKAAEELKQMAHGFPAIDRNTARILASIKMLEINVSDIIDL